MLLQQAEVQLTTPLYWPHLIVFQCEKKNHKIEKCVVQKKKSLVVLVLSMLSSVVNQNTTLPLTVKQGVFLPTFMPSGTFSTFQKVGHLTMVRWSLKVVFICFSHIAREPEHFPRVLLAIYIGSFETCLYISFARFFKESLVLPALFSDALCKFWLLVP